MNTEDREQMFQADIAYAQQAAAKATEVPLHESTSAIRWANEFIDSVRANRVYLDEAALMPWFRNALCAGIDAGIRRVRAKVPPVPVRNGMVLYKDGVAATVLDATPLVSVAAVVDVIQELIKASGKFPPLHSAHEGYAVLLEEIRELEKEVFRNPVPKSVTFTSTKERLRAEHCLKMRTEAKQVAAMALRFMVDVVPDAGK